MIDRPPRILLLGAGSFGHQHLREWQMLTDRGEAELVAVAVASTESARRLAPSLTVPVQVGLDRSTLASIDGVDIVTPAATHYELASECLQHTHVLVEKPLATSPSLARSLVSQAATHGRILMSGHVFRFHPLVTRLKALVSKRQDSPSLVRGAFVNAARPDSGRFDPALELLHWFDLIEFLFHLQPRSVFSVERNGVLHASLQYPGPLNAIFDLGWHGRQRTRHLNIFYAEDSIHCDFESNMIVETGPRRMKRWLSEEPDGALRLQLRTFARALRGGVDEIPDGAVGARAVETAYRCKPAVRRGKPRVAVIGGGVFGAACAIELGEFCDVTLYERHASLMTEASYLNQWRHHSGFHYPRSVETVLEIQDSRAAFEQRFGAAIVPGVDSYYCTAKSGNEITAQRYMAVCRSNGLCFRRQFPPDGVIDRAEVSLCIRSDESVYDFYRLREMIEGALRALPDVEVLLRTEVVDGSLEGDGSKRLTCTGPLGEEQTEFDYVVNATYANQNAVTRWLGLPMVCLRFDLCEIPVLEIPMPAVSVTILDGPFISLVSTGKDDLFMLSHIHHSIGQSLVTDDGLPPQWSDIQSAHVNMMRSAARYLPVITRARYIESRFSTRTVRADSDDVDGRPTVVTDHGFGCWSLLGGKVVTCVSNAQDIAGRIRAEWHGCGCPSPD